jgi:hypothetical protein
MSQAAEILTELQRRGVTVAIEGDTLCLKPKPALDDTLLASVRDEKPAILEVLRNRPATFAGCGSPHCAGCYDVGEGRRIHPPRCGEEYKREWLERWTPKGKVQ